MPPTVCEPEGMSSVCEEFSAQLNVCGAVNVEPSTMICIPGGLLVTVTLVGALL